HPVRGRSGELRAWRGRRASAIRPRRTRRAGCRATRTDASRPPFREHPPPRGAVRTRRIHSRRPPAFLPANANCSPSGEITRESTMTPDGGATATRINGLLPPRITVLLPPPVVSLRGLTLEE